MAIDSSIAFPTNATQLSSTFKWSDGNNWDVIPVIDAAGITHIGLRLDFHNQDAKLISVDDYDWRITIGTDDSSMLFKNDAGTTVFEITNAGNLIASGDINGRDLDADGSALDSHLLNTTSHIDWTTDTGGTTIATANLPGLALTDVNTVANETAQLALTAQEGDVAIRTDEGLSYAHNGGTAGTMSDWSELLNTAGTVISVGNSAPITSSGGSTPVIGITQATTSSDGYLTQTDWDTFNDKQPSGSYANLAGDVTQDFGIDKLTLGSSLQTANADSQLLNGSTAWSIIQGGANNHVVIQLRNNDSDESFAIVSDSTDGAGDADQVDFRVRRGGITDIAGNVTVSGVVNATSDETLKKNIVTYDNKTNALAIRAVNFNWKDEEKGTEKVTGYIAQEVEDIMPEAVAANENGIKSVNYNAVHTAKIAELEAKVNTQSIQIELLMTIVDALQSKK